MTWVLIVCMVCAPLVSDGESQRWSLWFYQMSSFKTPVTLALALDLAGAQRRVVCGHLHHN
jgi:hypothetical protein